MTETYRTIVADPPWPTMRGVRSANPGRGHPQRHYPVMTVPEIIGLPIADLADPDAHLWIWAINRLVAEAHAVARAWGFRPVTMLTWCKPGPGVGYYLRNNTEHAILATRGRAMPPERVPLSSWYCWPRGSHSRKPDDFYRLAEQVSPAPRLELFARWHRPGWAAWGNRVGSDVEVEGWQPNPATPADPDDDPGALFALGAL